MKRLIITCLTILMLLCTFAVVAAAASESEQAPRLEVNGANLSFENSVHLLYSVGYENVESPDDITLLVWKGDDITASECVKGKEDATLSPIGDVNDGKVVGKKFKFTDISAAEMTKNVYVRAYTVINGVEYYSSVKKYSVLQYAYNMLGYTGTESPDENLKAMLKSMLEYGAAAQAYFDVSTDRLATDSFVQIEVCGGHLADGTASGLYKSGDNLILTAATTAELPYVVWTDASGSAVGYGDTLEITVGKSNATYTATLSASAPDTVVKQEWTEDGELKILAIGNSYARNTFDWFPSIAAKEGVHKITIGVLYIGGCNLDTHYGNAVNDSAAYTYYLYTYDASTDTINTNVSQNENFVAYSGYKMSTALEAENWDFITLQQASSLSGIASSYSNLDGLVNVIADARPTSRIVWNMTWAYADDYENEAFAAYGNDKRTMYAAITSAVKSEVAKNEKIDIIVPLGTAIENARVAVGTELDSDGTHLSWAAGCYTAALTEYCTLLGVDATAVTHTSTHPYNDYSSTQGGTLSSADFTSAVRKAVDDAIAEPYSAYELPELEAPIEKPSWDEDNTLNVLFVGDYSVGNALEWFGSIARNEGISDINLVYLNGLTISDYATDVTGGTSNSYGYYYYSKSASDTVNTNVASSWTLDGSKTLTDVLALRDWDYIVIQQGIGSSGLSSTYSSLGTLVDGIAKKCPTSRIAFMMNYAWASTCTEPEFINNYGSSTSTMYAAMVDAMKAHVASLDGIDLFIPMGTAVENVRAALGTHLSETKYMSWAAGRYVSSLAAFCSLLERDAASITHTSTHVYNNYLNDFGGTLSSSDFFTTVRTAISNAIAHPFEITEATESEAAFKLYKGYYNSVSSGTTLINNDSLLERFYATELFTKETLPVGTVITVASGFQVRPERWTDGVSTARGDNTTETITITEEWWGNYTEAAFNISRTDGADLTSYTEEELRKIFIITFPN